jgi:hypothetical protein
MLRKAITGLIKDITKNKTGPNPEENPYIKLILIPTLSSLKFKHSYSFKKCPKNTGSHTPKNCKNYSVKKMDNLYAQKTSI